MRSIWSDEGLLKDEINIRFPTTLYYPLLQHHTMPSCIDTKDTPLRQQTITSARNHHACAVQLLATGSVRRGHLDVALVSYNTILVV